MPNLTLHEEAYQTTMGEYQTAIVDQEAAYRKAEIAGDSYSMSVAHRELAALHVQAEKAHQLAVMHAASMRPSAQSNKFGLSQDEIDVARSHPDDNLNNEQKEQLFASNKQRYQHNKAIGLHRDDQGAKNV